MTSIEYYNRMLKDLKKLKAQVLIIDTQKRRELGYIPITLPKPLSQRGRPLSQEVFTEKLNFITSTTLWLQSIMDKSNGLTSSCAIDLINLYPYPHPSLFKNHRGRKPLGKKTQEQLLLKHYDEAHNNTGIGMRSWIKGSKNVSKQVADVAREIIESGEPLLFMHIDELGNVKYEADSKKQLEFLDSRENIKNHEDESLLRALAKTKQKSPKRKIKQKKESSPKIA